MDGTAARPRGKKKPRGMHRGRNSYSRVGGLAVPVAAVPTPMPATAPAPTSMPPTAPAVTTPAAPANAHIGRTVVATIIGGIPVSITAARIAVITRHTDADAYNDACFCRGRQSGGRRDGGARHQQCASRKFSKSGHRSFLFSNGTPPFMALIV